MKEKQRSEGPRHPQASYSTSKRRENFPWRLLEQQVIRMQKQISQASQRGDRQAIHTLQQRLMESEAARLLAVRRVAEENQGKDTAGVDGVKSLSLQERLAMASAIHPRHWNKQPPLPVRRVWVPKPGTAEWRPLAILPMIDRCKQALVKLALEPEWEVRFEGHSYGFRPGRSAHDAIAAIVVAIQRQPMFVFDADIEEAFEHVNRAVVLEQLQTYPALRQMIDAWLRVGVLDGQTYTTTTTGIAQGGVLSPLLMNVALHGMEAAVTGGTTPQHGRQRPLLVRYADDFLILHPDLQELRRAIRRVEDWLARRGLSLHADKTRVRHTLIPSQGQAGFDFVGFHIHQEPTSRDRRDQEIRAERQNVSSPLSGRLPHQETSWRGKTIVTPSQEASRRHLAAIDQRLQQLHAASQARVIQEINPLIAGWTAYYNGVVPPASMSRYDELLEQRLLSWASKRHPDGTRDWLLSRYWQPGKERKRVFAAPDGKVLRTYRQTSILKNESGQPATRFVPER